jgi:tetratricopeptide (TPR) repeat protein
VSEPDARSETSVDADRLEALYEQARALDANARLAFLADACAADAGLERELVSLLGHGEPAEAFFATLADAVVSPSVGHRIGQYRLIGMLGSGGMGTVYRAHDDRLDRSVALKFLPLHLSAQPEARERFLVEARAAAALDHPNVCSIHEIGETADGRPFIAMACYDGETLRERLGRGPLPSREAIRIALALGRGLAAAHGRGIVHRDVKPGNVMLCADGSVRLLDFGLAKVNDTSLSGPGGTPGTIAYMAPEQARGDPVDARADLWSLGVILHEMLSGTRPFRGGNDRAVIQAIFHDAPPPLPRGLGDIPASLQRVVKRLLQKVPDDRFRSANDLIRDLARAAPSRTPAMVAAALVGVTTLLVFALLLHSRRRLLVSVDPADASLTLAVLPFTVRGPGLEVWREGLVDLLSIGLDGAAGIRTINNRTLLARWHEAIGDSATADLESALGVARRSHARYALVGAAVAAASRLRLSADIYDVATGRIVGPVEVEGPTDSVLALVDRLGMLTLGVMLEKHSGVLPALDLAAFTTGSLGALKAYLEGEEHFRRAEFSEAVHAWERAVRADSLFALADLGLADGYAWLGQYDRLIAALDRARAMKDRLPGRERAMMEIRWQREHGGVDVVATIREALRRYPDAADAWYELGEAYYHDAVAYGRPEDAEDAFRTSTELQPSMAPYHEHLLDLAFLRYGDSAHIAPALATYSRSAPHGEPTIAGRIVFALGFGDSAARRAARAELGTLDSKTAAHVYRFMAHPYFTRLRDDVYQAIEPRLDRTDRALLQADRMKSLALTDGRVRDALAALREPGTPAFMRNGGVLYLSVLGIPMPEGVLKDALAAARNDTSLFAHRMSVVSAAAVAARLGEWGWYDEFVSAMRKSAVLGRAAGDSDRVAYWDWAAQVAEAHGLWRRGRKDESLRRFERLLATHDGFFVLWSVAEVSLELGRLDQAERTFRALWRNDETPAFLELARLLARTGRRAEAREAYRFVVDAWRGADPELQPMVDEARRALTP